MVSSRVCRVLLAAAAVIVAMAEGMPTKDHELESLMFQLQSHKDNQALKGYEGPHSGHQSAGALRNIVQEGHLLRNTRGIDSLTGVTYGTQKRFDSLGGVTYGGHKRSLGVHLPYQLLRSGALVDKKNFDEIDRSGFDSFVKKNFDEIDRGGFDTFIKRAYDLNPARYYYDAE